MKVCTKCRGIFPLSFFYKDTRKKDNLTSHCKQCFKNYHQTSSVRAAYITDNKTLLNQRTKQIRHRNRAAWLDFFRDVYGVNPCCGVCGVLLMWSGVRKTVVHFDHRHSGQETIKTVPWHFTEHKSCNKDNQSIWLGCDFGILCGKCNGALPTYGRLEWLKKATEYAENK